MGVLEEMCMLHAVVVLCFCCWQGLANRSMRIQDVYVGAVLILIRKNLFAFVCVM